jgi:glycosyltransferase 2 family protein
MTKKRALLLVSLLLLLYIIVPRLHSFSDSFDVVRRANPGYMLATLGLLAVSYFSAAAVYWSLALRRLAFMPTLKIQVASAFTNRLLPAGLGTLTLYVQYLRKSKHSLAQAITVAGTNNLMGMFGHLVLLVIVLSVTHDAYPAKLQLPSTTSLWLILGAIVAIMAVNLLIFRRLREAAYKITREVVGYAANYRKTPGKLLRALLFSVVLTVLYSGMFYCCTQAVGINMSLGHIFLVFTIGLIVGTATPTPGGLIGAEAGLTGGLIAYGADPDMALAAALLFRFFTYWLPLAPGFIMFARVRKLYS